MTKFASLRIGEKLSETQFYSVDKIKEDKVRLLPDSGEAIVVDKEYVENFLTSANQFNTEAEISKTEAANFFLSSERVVLTVNYNTQVDKKEALAAMEAIYPNKGGKMLSETDYKKKVKEILTSVTVGKERTMIGRHYGSQNEFGRVSFIDMEKEKDPAKPEYDSRTRQVDPRTINWMIIRGVKYTVKTK